METWPIERLIPSARNARTHSDAQVAEIAGSIRAFGFSNPILIGTEVQRQLILADNRIALNAGWDLKILHLEVKDLSLLSADLSALGFTTQELAQALASASTTGLTDEDQVPELEGNAISATGDVWCLGRHRICCGDSTDPAAVAAVLASKLGEKRRATGPPMPTWDQNGSSRKQHTSDMPNDVPRGGPTNRVSRSYSAALAR